MLAATRMHGGIGALFPARYRSLMSLMGLTIIGSLVASLWLLPSRLERVAVAVEQGAPLLIRQELDRATREAADPGEVRALVDVALTIGAPELAASILDRLLMSRPNSAEALRMLLDVQRQRHLVRQVASLDERLHTLTGDVDALREAADIYASLHMAPERVSALRRLAGLGIASASEIGELVHRMADLGDGSGALELLMAWLGKTDQPLPSDLVGLAAGLSATMPAAQAVASELGAVIDRSGQIGPLHVLVQTYAERGHPELSLAAGSALGHGMARRPDVALVLAQLEAAQGKSGAARERLDALARDGTLVPAGLRMLAELALQAGDLRRAVAVVASLAADEISEGLPHRLVEAVDAAGQTELLLALPLDRVAGSSPVTAASIAMAQGDRIRAAALVREALAIGAGSDDFGPAFGRVVRSLGLEHEAIARLLTASKTRPLDDRSLSLVVQLAENRPGELRPLIEATLHQRDGNPQAGVTWSMLAARDGQGAAVVSWLKGAAPSLPTQALIDLLVISSERRDRSLADGVSAALAHRTDLPAGWSQDEIALTRHVDEPWSPARLRKALDLLGKANADLVQRDRLAALLISAPGLAQAVQRVRLDASDPAIAWLRSALAADVASPNDYARLLLLTSLAPDQALPILSGRLSTDRLRLTPLHVAALLPTGQTAAGQAELRSFVRDLPQAQQDAKLHEVLGLLPPSEALAVLRVGASSIARADWVAAYDEALVKAGLLDELRASLRTRATAAGNDAKQLQALASRMVELNDRRGAVAVMLAAAAGKPPAAPEVEQLMYLWGPRDAPDAVAWTSGQALAAPLADLPTWLEHLAYLGDPKAVIAVAERRQAVFAQSATAVRTYDAAVSAARGKAAVDVQAAVASAVKPDVLAALAQLALDIKQPAVAWQAARASLATQAGSRETLLLAAQSAAALRRSDDAAAFYMRLIAMGEPSAEIYVDAGDALIAARREADGRKLLQTALDHMPATPTTLATARLKARALTLLGDHGGARALLTAWLARAPGHAGVVADLAQSDLASSAGDRE